jgi:hypothetical protein
VGFQETKNSSLSETGAYDDSPRHQKENGDAQIAPRILCFLIILHHHRNPAKFTCCSFRNISEFDRVNVFPGHKAPGCCPSLRNSHIVGARSSSKLRRTIEKNVRYCLGVTGGGLDHLPCFHQWPRMSVRN